MNKREFLTKSLIGAGILSVCPSIVLKAKAKNKVITKYPLYSIIIRYETISGQIFIWDYQTWGDNNFKVGDSVGVPLYGFNKARVIKVRQIGCICYVDKTN